MRGELAFRKHFGSDPFFPLNRNPNLVTALKAFIGYGQGAAIAKKAYAEGRAVIDVAKEETDLSEKERRRLLDSEALTRGGIKK